MKQKEVLKVSVVFNCTLWKIFIKNWRNCRVQNVWYLLLCLVLMGLLVFNFQWIENDVTTVPCYCTQPYCTQQCQCISGWNGFEQYSQQTKFLCSHSIQSSRIITNITSKVVSQVKARSSKLRGFVFERKVKILCFWDFFNVMQNWEIDYFYFSAGSLFLLLCVPMKKMAVLQNSINFVFDEFLW